MTETYYTVLEVVRSASPAEIRDAYLKLIRQMHPDLLANAPEYWKRRAEEKSKDVTEAYRVLSDTETRSFYDQQLDARLDAQTSEPRTAKSSHCADQTTRAKDSRTTPFFTKHCSWPATLSKFPQRLVGALVCILVIMYFVWPWANRVLVRRILVPAPSAVTTIQPRPSVPNATARIPLPVQPRASKELNNPLSARAQETRSGTRKAQDDGLDTARTSQHISKFGRGGQILQWDGRTRSWHRMKHAGVGSSTEKEIQWNVQWDDKTNSWQIVDPDETKSALR